MRPPTAIRAYSKDPGIVLADSGPSTVSPWAHVSCAGLHFTSKQRGACQEKNDKRARENGTCYPDQKRPRTAAPDSMVHLPERVMQKKVLCTSIASQTRRRGSPAWLLPLCISPIRALSR